MADDLRTRFPDARLQTQPTADGVETLWVSPNRLVDVLRHLKESAQPRFEMLYDVTAIDARSRGCLAEEPEHAFAAIYHLHAFAGNREIRLKVPLPAGQPRLPSITALWPCANWYERELWDMFGIGVEGHPHLERILMPPWWVGHPLRKEHPARATEMGTFRMPEAEQIALEQRLRFDPVAWGLATTGKDFDYLFLNIGPHHPGTHGLLRLFVQLKGQQIAALVPEIGFHHRGAEKMGERQSWHTYIPYTDRVDYLSGVLNNFPYVLAVEALAGIQVPERAQVIRILMAELYRIVSHLVFYGTFCQDVGQMSPVFHMFTDRERAFDITEAITGARMHPGWFRIGGVAQDLPAGWETLVREFLDYLPRRLDEYDRTVLRNGIFRARTEGIGLLSTADALEWGATGPMLRSTGLAWDLRKRRPYGGYDRFAFDIPTGKRGDCYDRVLVHVEEMRQSLRIIGQCLARMPSGDYIARHPLATPPNKARTMHDIETLIAHFLNVSWGPAIPPGEASICVEGSKGINSYYLVSDGGVQPYRVRIRTPSFPHMQMLPMLSQGLMLPDLIAILGSVDFVLADVDR